VTSKQADFEALCREEYAAVVRTAWLITGDREEAVDIAQETFVRAYERWRQVAQLDRPGGWLTRVAANLALSWRRGQRVRRRAHRPLPAPPPASDSAVDPELLRALDGLTPAQRAVIVLRYLCDLSVDDVARTLGKRPGTVRALTSQALDRLRNVLDSEEVRLDAGE
jgi:RNA polymerase sigma-70 factor (sigma-E family)